MSPVPSSISGPDREFLHRLIVRIRDDERVAALFLGGSHAGGTADRFSDLDLYLITTDDGFEHFLDERRDLMESLGKTVFLEEHSEFGFQMMLFILANGVRGEMAIAPSRDLDDVHSGPFEVLLDRTGIMENHGFRRGGLDEFSRSGLIHHTLVWFWYDRVNLDAALSRGNLWTAHHYLERCRGRCLDLAWVAALPEVWPGGHEKAEAILDAAMSDALARTVVPLEAVALEGATRVVTDFYRQLGPAIACSSGLNYPTALDEAVEGLMRAWKRGQTRFVHRSPPEPGR